MRRKITGVGHPTGQEINSSNPGFNQQFSGKQITQPNLGLEYSRKDLSTIDLDLGGVYDTQRVRANGTFLYYASAVDSAGAALFDRPITIQFDRSSAASVRFLPGMMLSGFPFDTLYISSPGYTAGDLGQLIAIVDAPDDRVLVE